MFSAYRAVSLLSRTVKAGTGMDSRKSASRPENTTPCAAKAVNITPAATAIPAIISRSRSSAPDCAKGFARAKL